MSARKMIAAGPMVDRDSIATQNLRNALTLLKVSNKPREYMAALTTLHLVVSHILQHPEEESCRTLHKHQPDIERLTGLKGGEEALLAVGFKKETQGGKGDTTYVLAGFVKKRNRLLESLGRIHVARVQVIGDDTNSVKNPVAKRGMIKKCLRFIRKKTGSGKEQIGKHHYNLVHKIMQQRCHEDPVGFFKRMKEDKVRFLAFLWTSVCGYCDWTGIPGFDICDLIIEFVVVNGQRLMLISMPPLPPTPRNKNCAFFVAVSLHIVEKSNRRKVSARFFTLEKMKTKCYQREDRGLICEWAPNGIHYDFGITSKIDANEFSVAVTDLLGCPQDVTWEETRQRQTFSAAA